MIRNAPPRAAVHAHHPPLGVILSAAKDLSSIFASPGPQSKRDPSSQKTFLWMTATNSWSPIERLTVVASA
jgi:hypothetical protein